MKLKNSIWLAATFSILLSTLTAAGQVRRRFRIVFPFSQPARPAPTPSPIRLRSWAAMSSWVMETTFRRPALTEKAAPLSSTQ